MSKSTPQERLEEYVKWVFFSEENMADFVGLTVNELRKYFNPNLKLLITDPNILEKLEQRDVFIEYYLEGSGPMADLSCTGGNVGMVYDVENIPEGKYRVLPLNNDNKEPFLN